MENGSGSALFELADVVLGVGRRLNAAADRSVDVCTPVESAVMRFIDQHPGTTPGVAAEAAGLPSSNLSRVLRRLEAKGLVNLSVSDADARLSSIYPTALARENLAALAAAWEQTLAGILTPQDLASALQALRTVEAVLVERALHHRPARSASYAGTPTASA